MVMRMLFDHQPEHKRCIIRRVVVLGNKFLEVEGRRQFAGHFHLFFELGDEVDEV
jgi:hypothetical protein